MPQCLDHWRYMFDTVTAVMDQQLLKYVVQDPERCVPFLLDGMNKSHYSLYNPRELAKGRDAHLCPHHQQPGQQEHNTSKRAAAKCVEVEQSTNGTTLRKYHVERGHSANRPV